MASRTRNLLKSRKAQFFILSAVAIIGILYFLSRWLEPSSIIDTSSIVSMEEPFVFNNVKEKAVETVQNSKSCEELKYNLEEYNAFVENYAIEKNYIINLNYTYDCFTKDVDFNMKLTSTKASIESNFTAIWLG